MRFLQHLASISFLLASAFPVAFPVSGANVVCPSILKPVCAERSGETRTFPNGCLAEASDYAIIGSGRCKADRLAQTICTKEYLPVCGEKDGVRRTFGNECEARAAGFVVVAEGEC